MSIFNSSSQREAVGFKGLCGSLDSF